MALVWPAERIFYAAPVWPDGLGCVIRRVGLRDPASGGLVARYVQRRDEPVTGATSARPGGPPGECPAGSRSAAVTGRAPATFREVRPMAKHRLISAESHRPAVDRPDASPGWRSDTSFRGRTRPDPAGVYADPAGAFADSAGVCAGSVGAARAVGVAAVPSGLVPGTPVPGAHRPAGPGRHRRDPIDDATTGRIG